MSAQENVAPTQPQSVGVSPAERALIAEACSKSGVVWVRPVGDSRYHAAWHVWHDDAVAIVYDGDEQKLPSLVGDVEVSVPSKDAGSRLVTFRARGEVLGADSPQWTSAAESLSKDRLNEPTPDDQHARWRARSVLVRLVPVAITAQGPGSDDEGSQSQPPAGNPGTTLTWRPYHAGGRKLRRGNKPVR